MMNLEQITPHLLYQFSSESELVGSIETMSRNFTEARENISNYLQSEKLVSAYTCFYLTTNFNKWGEVLKKCEIDHKILNDYEIVDIGAGPGTFSLSILAQNPEQQITLIESAKLMRLQADKLLKALHPDRNIKISASSKSVPKKEKLRLGVFGHSANEMEVEMIMSIISDLELDQILFIEPGTKDFYQKFNSLREDFKRLQFQILYPCSTQEACPLSAGDWCHQYLYLQHSEDVERIAQIAKKNRRLLPISIYYLSKNLDNNFSQKRIIRVYKPTKYSFEYQVCFSENGENKVLNIEQQKRKLSKSDIKKLEGLYAGDSIEYELVKVLNDQKHRVDIKL